MTRKVYEKSQEFLKSEFNIRETLTLLSSYKFKFWSWGGHTFVNVDNKGSLFKVNGHHHKGYVLITLDWTDTYEVHLISTHGNVIKSFEMVYRDMLFELIDNNIERIPEYVR